MPCASGGSQRAPVSRPNPARNDGVTDSPSETIAKAGSSKPRAHGASVRMTPAGDVGAKVERVPGGLVPVLVPVEPRKWSHSVAHQSKGNLGAYVDPSVGSGPSVRLLISGSAVRIRGGPLGDFCGNSMTSTAGGLRTSAPITSSGAGISTGKTKPKNGHRRPRRARGTWAPGWSWASAEGGCRLGGA
jgi:hypothetical protein